MTRYRLHIHDTARHGRYTDGSGWYPALGAGVYAETGGFYPGVYVGWQYRQGRCDPCHLRFVWRGSPRVSDADCPVCSKPLRQTVHSVRLLTVHALGKRRRP